MSEKLIDAILSIIQGGQYKVEGSNEVVQGDSVSLVIDYLRNGSPRWNTPSGVNAMEDLAIKLGFRVVTGYHTTRGYRARVITL